MRKPDARARLRDLQDLLRPAVAREGFDLEDVEITSAGRRDVVRVVVDSDEGVSLDGVAQVSQVVSAALDDADDLLGGPYVLEVSSPGVDRPLSSPRHWRRARGRLVQTTVAGAPLAGRIVAADDRGVVLEVAGAARPATWAELGRGRVQVEFRRAEQPAAADEAAVTQ